MPEKNDQVTIYTDGGSRGNPGPAAAGFILADKCGNTLKAKGLFLGESTNNTAEYIGMIRALETANQIGVSVVTVYSDSQLLVRQINGQYKVKSENLKELYQQVVGLLNSFEKWKVVHIYRDKNTEADRMVNLALDSNADVDESPKDSKKEKPIRIGVLLSGGGRTLMNILEKINQAQLNAEVAIVISSLSKVNGVQRAKKAGLDVKIVCKKDFADIAEFSEKIEEELVAANVDLVVQAGWLCLWKIPRRFKNKVMNIHPALLPSFGGKGMWGHHVHEAVLKRGCKISGCTVHFCTNKYDDGPIVVQRVCGVKEGDTPDSLAESVFEQECIAYPEAIALFAKGRLNVKGNKVEIK